MRQLIGVAAAVLACAASTTSYAQTPTTLVITSGRDTGAYYKVFAPKLAASLKQSSITASIETSNGSTENLQKILEGKAQIGFAQSDAISLFMEKNPTAVTAIDMGVKIADECVFIAALEKSKIRSDDDLQKGGFTIAVGTPKDGSYSTWQYLTKLEPKFKGLKTADFGGMTAFSKLQSNQVDAVLFVSTKDSELFKQVVNDKNLRFVEITDWDLNNKLPNGKQVYDFGSVSYKKPGDWTGSTLDTVCMPTYVIHTTKLSESALESLSRAMLNMLK